MPAQLSLPSKIAIGPRRRLPIGLYMDSTPGIHSSPEVDLLHAIGSRMAAADPFHEVLSQVVDCAVSLVKCDSCLIFVLDGQDLILRASKNPHADQIDKLKLRVGQGITGWVAANRAVVAISQNASQDPRFQFFNDLPEDKYQAFLSVPLLCRGGLVGVINLQHIQPHIYKQRDIRLITTVGFLVGAKIEMARLETKNSQLSDQLETRKLVERAKGILQRDMGFDEERAYLALQQQSRQTRQSMKRIAEAVIMTDEMKRAPRPENQSEKISASCS
jgi:signal transduction protein with GAF and PtsI domain